MARGGAIGGTTVKVEGYRELDKAFRDLDKASAKAFRAEMASTGDVVRDDARARLSDRSPRSAAGFVSKAKINRVVVEQKLRKTTGKRGDWGALQMREALIPALDEHGDELERNVAAALAKAAKREGF